MYSTQKLVKSAKKDNSVSTILLVWNTWLLVHTFKTLFLLLFPLVIQTLCFKLERMFFFFVFCLLFFSLFNFVCCFLAFADSLSRSHDSLICRPPVGTDLLRLPRGTHGALGMKLHQHGVEEAVPPTGPTGATTVRNTSHNHRSKAILTGAAIYSWPSHWPGRFRGEIALVSFLDSWVCLEQTKLIDDCWTSKQPRVSDVWHLNISLNNFLLVCSEGGFLVIFNFQLRSFQSSLFLILSQLLWSFMKNISTEPGMQVMKIERFLPSFWQTQALKQFEVSLNWKFFDTFF